MEKTVRGHYDISVIHTCILETGDCGMVMLISENELICSF